ncbi:MAG: cysteine peptidase family C39 domain-containing protein [Bacteroidota bacterium]
MSFPFYKQKSALSCGVACLRMIAKYFGKDYNSKYFKSFAEQKETNMLQLNNAAEKLGFKTLCVKISLKKLIKEAPLPCILHWNNNHFVVLYDIKKTNLKKETIFSIANPSLGLLQYEQKEMTQHWYNSESKNLGIALLFDAEI